MMGHSDTSLGCGTKRGHQGNAEEKKRKQVIADIYYNNKKLVKGEDLALSWLASASGASWGGC